MKLIQKFTQLTVLLKVIVDFYCAFKSFKTVVKNKDNNDLRFVNIFMTIFLN